MSPLSARRRRIYFALLCLVFLAGIPILSLYATGYRLDDSLKIFRTGGIFVRAEYSGSEVLLDGEPYKRTSIINRHILVDNLRTGSYNIEVQKDGYQDWSHTLFVTPELVSQTDVFMLPKEIPLLNIPLEIAVDTADTTKNVASSTNPEYTEALGYFTATTTAPIDDYLYATSTRLRSDRGHVRLEKIESTLYAFWTGTTENAPYFFCDENECVKVLTVTEGKGLGSFELYPGRSDVVMVANQDGIYAYQIDARGNLSPQTVYTGDATDFRITDNGEILVIDKDQIFALDI